MAKQPAKKTKDEIEEVVEEIEEVTEEIEEEIEAEKIEAPKDPGTAVNLPKHKKFWKGRIAIRHTGTVEGKVKEEDWKAFCSLLNPKSDPVSFTSDIDIIAEARKEAERKYKKRHEK